MRRPSKSSIDYYILPNKIICSIAGMWPIDEKSSTSSKLFAYFRLLFALTAVINVFVPEIMALAVNWGDLQVLAGVGCVLTTVGQLLFKMIYLVARKKQAYWLYNELRDLWNTAEDIEEKQSYEQLAYWGKTITLVFYLSGMCNVFTFTIAAAFDYVKIEQNQGNNTNKSPHLPFQVWYGTDITGSPIYEITFVCQVVSSVICCAGIAGFDTTFMTIILHVCGQFKLINTWFNKLEIEISDKSTHAVCLLNVEARLIRCIRHHQRMINVVMEVNNLLTPIIFIQLLTSGVEICLSGFAVTDNNGTHIDQLKCISYLISMWIQLVLWCWAGEILIQESQQIGHVIYFNVSWYSLSPFYRRQLCFIIVRAQQYCSIKALTFQTLSIHTLTSVYQTAASYFTLLRQMQQT